MKYAIHTPANSRLGQGTERALGTNPKELFERVWKDKQGAFNRDGPLPAWFSGA